MAGEREPLADFKIVSVEKKNYRLLHKSCGTTCCGLDLDEVVEVAIAHKKGCPR